MPQGCSCSRMTITVKLHRQPQKKPLPVPADPGSQHLHAMTTPSPPPRESGTDLEASQNSSSVSSQSPDAHWVVQDILAERTSVTGDNEALVVWKASWIPISNLNDGPVLRAWRLTPMWTTSAMTMQVMLAVEPGTQLAEDCERVQDAERGSKKQRLPAPAARNSS